MTHKTRPTGRVSTLIERRDRFFEQLAIGRPRQTALLRLNLSQTQQPTRPAQAA